MTPEEILLDMIGGPEAVPELDSDTLTRCLLKGAVPDADGLYVGNDDWTPTYDYHRAAAEAWRAKAARVASDYSITIEGRELNRAQMIDNFLKMSNEEKSLAQPRYFAAPDQSADWRI